MTRYARPLVVLHWLIAILVIVGLIAGNVVLDRTPNSDPGKLTSLAAHMSIGLTVLLLMVVRVIVRARTGAPAPVNRLAQAGHWVLYGAVFAMALSGMALSQAAGLPAIVFGGQGVLPEDFSGFVARRIHGAVGTVLALLILGHVAAAIWHRIKGEDVLHRMSLRR